MGLRAGWRFARSRSCRPCSRTVSPCIPHCPGPPHPGDDLRPERRREEDEMSMTTRIEVPREWLEPAHAMGEIEIPGITPWRRGKVRSVYEAGPEEFVIVASDRLSAYDSVLP